MNRTRQKTGEVRRGYRRIGVGGEFYSQYTSMTSTMTDVVGNPKGDNPALADTVTKLYGVLNGTTGTPGTGGFRQLVDFPINDMSVNSIPHVSIPDMPTWASMALMGAARANPGNPSIQLPVSLVELRELPRMTFQRYNGRRKQSNSIAESEFGWAPMVSDIQKIFSFPELFESRLRTLRALAKAPLRRQRKVWEGEAFSPLLTNVLESSTSGVDVRATSQRHTVADCRVSTTWKANRDIPTLGDSEMSKLAARLVLGLEGGQQLLNLWELLPWSWLADWFFQFGDLLQTWNGSVATNSGPACVTLCQRTKWNIRITSKPAWVSVRNPDISRKTWERRILHPGFESLGVPLLTTRQTLILSSIAFSIGR